MSVFSCNECGRFISHKDAEAHSWIYFGTAYDTEPSDPIICCGKCWNKKTENDLKLLGKICWQGPYYLNTIEQLHKQGEL